MLWRFHKHILFGVALRDFFSLVAWRDKKHSPSLCLIIFIESFTKSSIHNLKEFVKTIFKNDQSIFPFRDHFVDSRILFSLQ